MSNLLKNKIESEERLLTQLRNEKQSFKVVTYLDVEKDMLLDYRIRLKEVYIAGLRDAYELS